MPRRKATAKPDESPLPAPRASRPPRQKTPPLTDAPAIIDEFYRLPLSSGEAVAVLAFLQALQPSLSALPQTSFDPAILQSAADRIAAELPEFAADNAARLAKSLRQTLSAALNDMKSENVIETASLSIRDKIAALELALEGDSPVEIRYYVASRDEWTRRLVDVADVYEDDGKWYCEGYCRLRREHRLFRVDNIGSLRLRDDVVS